MTKNVQTLRRMAGLAAIVALTGLVVASCDNATTTNNNNDTSGNNNQTGQAITVDMGGGITMTMNRIPSGVFTMGQNDGLPNWSPTPERQVTLTRSFHMGIHPVTQEQFQAVMGANPSAFLVSPAAGEVQARRPVENVNWYHAIAFANRLSILQGLTPVYSIACMSNTDADPWLFENVPIAHNGTWNAVTANWNANGFRLATEAEWECVDKARKTAIITTKCPASTLGMIS